MRARPTAHVRGLTAYRGQGVPRGDLVRLDGSEGINPVLESEVDRVEWPRLLRSYPDSSDLARALAGRLEVEPDRIVIGAGADEILDRCCRAYLSPRRTMVLPTPSFAMFRHYARLAGSEILEVPWDGAEFPTQAVVKAIDERTGLIVCVSPNNPTGALISSADLARVSRGARHALVVLDHAYVEYAEDGDLTQMAIGLPNVCVVRTFSKAWGLAGARVGWAVASRQVADTLRAAGGPYSVAGPSLELALRRLEAAEAEVERHVRAVRGHRQRLLAEAEAMGLRAVASHSNFVCFEAAERAPFLFDGLLAQGILTRTFESRPTAVRVAVPEDAGIFAKLSGALATVLAPEALLFDLDGVVADVSRSQRVCIRETAAAFGVRVEPVEVSEAVLAGDANDDWLLTQRLLADRGCEVGLAAVKERYQQLYLGGGQCRGLREREERLVEPAVLARLAARIPLAIVTGRPRAEADWFLRRQNLDGFFATLVTAEDARRKPDPEPVKLALRRLGVRRAWMLGDTPDDMRSARAAGVLPVAVIAPADDPERARQRLRESGAAFILKDWEDLERWIR